MVNILIKKKYIRVKLKNKIQNIPYLFTLKLLCQNTSSCSACGGRHYNTLWIVETESSVFYTRKSSWVKMLEYCRRTKDPCLGLASLMATNSSQLEAFQQPFNFFCSESNFFWKLTHINGKILKLFLATFICIANSSALLWISHFKIKIERLNLTQNVFKSCEK